MCECENDDARRKGRKLGARSCSWLTNGPGAAFASFGSMRSGCFLVFDFDEDIAARFRNADSAVRFARWLARGRREESRVVVSDEARSGAIVWTEPQPGNGDRYGQAPFADEIAHCTDRPLDA